MNGIELQIPPDAPPQPYPWMTAMIKDLMVHLDGSAEDEVRLGHVQTVATTIGAHVTGLFTNPLPDYATVMPIEAGAAAVSVVADIEEQLRREGDAITARLVERLDRLEVPTEVRRIDERPANLARLAARQARWADLFVASCPYRNDAAGDWAELVEAVLLESGRGIMLIPPGRPAPDTIRRVLIGWRDCREAARAVAEALPLITRATRTDIVYAIVRDDELVARSADDLATHLDRHGAKVEVHSVDRAGRAAAEVLLDQAHRLSADLIVMGGYGHSRLREWFTGGTTRDVITLTDTPLLLAH
ncbi:universal stress protein [Chelatococcus reniformis]|uniref:Universal stress protein UspA n=1 Tax=Chelatococcus reniformis TaxID=1494448 RepID=A0A916XEG4_9HYPH|nr:universal stress protein [Chelatococcus reniformis]GGC65924.1 universal stress protein UspA [Chelatococcus reniformis]